MKPSRAHTQKSKDLNKSHIEEKLERKSDHLLNKYQTEIQDLLEQIDTKQPYRKAVNLETGRSIRKQRALSSIRRSEGQNLNEPREQNHSMNDYQRLILGLEYSLETERKKNQELTLKNLSLESEISNLRNLLTGPDQQKHYEKTAYKQAQEKITYLEDRIIEQKKNYQDIIDAKNEDIVTLQREIKSLKKNIEKDDKAMSKKALQLMAINDELRHSITKKNIQLEKLKYYKPGDEADSDDDQVGKIRKAERVKFYLEQLQISNKLILRKNIQILTLSNKVMNYQKILDVIEMYLDKKEVKGVDLNILEHICVNKLRILLREKAVFERQLLSQLNDHNKKISVFETEMIGREKSSSQKMTQIINDNKHLSQTVKNLQINLGNVEKQLDNEKKQNELLNNQIVINKRQFVQQVSKLKDQMQKISSVTKNEFDRMKIENLKLSQQNRSLLFLVGEKERQIHKKGETLKTFEQYREKINTLDVGEKQRRKIDSVAQDQPQIGSKLLLINTFSGWLFEWNKMKNWNNKKILLNLILDKEQIRNDAVNSMGYLINVLHECILNSRNVDIQQRAIILLSQFVDHKILKNQSLYLNKIAPIAVKNFRPKIEGEDDTKHRILNQSALRITNQLEKDGFKWSYEMTNEMISVNGLKFVFNTITRSKIDDLVQFAYNTLILIARQNEMISFMISFNMENIILDNLMTSYSFIIYVLTLLKTLIQSNDYMRSQKVLPQYRKLFNILAQDDDEELLQLVEDIILAIIDKNSFFLKGVNKIQAISILSQVLRSQQSFQLLKKCGKLYISLISQLQNENISRYRKQELKKILQILQTKRFNENRYNRAIRILNKVVPLITQSNQFDEEVLSATMNLFGSYENIQIETRTKINEFVFVIYERNQQAVNSHTNDTVISNLVQAYKLSNYHEEITFLLTILIFQTEQRRTTEILRSGRESLINKLIADALVSDYKVTINSLKLLLAIVKEKYSQKFIDKNIVSQIIGKVLNERSEEEYIRLTLSILYFLCKVDTISAMAIESSIVGKICNVITQRHDSEQIIFKCLAVLQVCHTNNYKKKILNYFLANDSNLQVLKTISFILRKSKNKVDLGSRAVFIYDYLNGKTPIESLAILTERNEWVVEDLVMLRNQYVGKVDSLVYKIQMILHEMSQKSNKVRRLYQKYKVEDDDSGND